MKKISQVYIFRKNKMHENMISKWHKSSLNLMKIKKKQVNILMLNIGNSTDKKRNVKTVY